MDIVYQLKEHGYVTNRAYFGITVRDMDSSVADTYGLPVGAFVDSVNAGSCAEKAGLQQGDIIVGLGDKTIENKTQLLGVLQEYHAGDTAKVKVYRSGAELELTVTFDQRPPESELNQQLEQAQQDQQPQQDQSSGYGQYGFDFGDAFGFGNG